MVGFENLSAALSWGRVDGPSTTMDLSTARELSVIFGGAAIFGTDDVAT